MSRRPERRMAPSGAQVLVVDDEPDIRELLELTLVKMGLGVASVGILTEAKELLRQQRYDLCLTDMRLADGEGLELVRHIASLAIDLPVAVITAHGSAQNAVAALKAGAALSVGVDHPNYTAENSPLAAATRDALLADLV